MVQAVHYISKARFVVSTTCECALHDCTSTRQKYTYATKASVAPVHSQILRPNFNVLCSQYRISHYYFTLLVRFPLKDTDINCTSNSVHICTIGCQPLLRALTFAQHVLCTTATCFSKLIAYIFWWSSFGQNLIQFATHCCPTAIACKHCLCDMQTRRALHQLAQKCPSALS
jgi:hypothetical protein